MSRLPKGKAKFYRKCKLDDYTKKIIRFYNKNLRLWKSGKKIYVGRPNEEE